MYPYDVSATRIPLLVSVPESVDEETTVWARNTRCERAVSSLDIYPTLVDICGLEPIPALEGTSLSRLLRDPKASSHPPALTTWRQGNHAVRSDRYRYIRYKNGEEELYDHETDSLERVNLALQTTGMEDIIKAHARWLPGYNASPAPGKTAFEFNWKEYTWTRK